MGETAAGGTTFVPLSCVLRDGKDLSCGSSVRTEIFPRPVAGTAKPSPTTSGWFLIGNQFGPQHLWSVGLLGADSADYLQQIKHKLGSVIPLGALGQCRQQ